MKPGRPVQRILIWCARIFALAVLAVLLTAGWLWWYFQPPNDRTHGTVEWKLRDGEGHAWLGMLWEMRGFAKWFDEYLR